MKRDCLILHKERIDYFRRLESAWFKIISIDDHEGEYKKISFDYDKEHVAMIILETFTYGAIYGIDTMSRTKSDVDDAQREVTFSQDINFSL